MTKFNKTLTFDGARELDRRSSGVLNKNLEVRPKRRASSTAKLEKERQFIKTANQQVDDSENQAPEARLDATGEFSPSFVGLAGVFIPIQNDFTTPSEQANNQKGEEEDEEELPDFQQSEQAARYRDAPHWPSQKRAKVKRFRFVICLLALFGLALGLMSRLMLNVSIVEMVRKPAGDLEVPAGDDLTNSNGGDFISFQGTSSTASSIETAATDLDLNALINDDPLIYAANYGDNNEDTPNVYSMDTSTTTTTETAMSSVEDSNSTLAKTDQDAVKDENTEDDGLRFDWSKQDVNLILGSFYVGYMPGILFSSDLAQRYGAKYPLLFCILGTAFINFATPAIARISLNLLIGSRILLGLIQGSLIPALYELFNRWLTQTESSIFAPMIKVSMPLGSLIGTLMPGILARYQLAWPTLFHLGGLMCASWSLVWLFVATSRPQTNRFVEQDELNRIMRKKSAAFKMVEMPPRPPQASGIKRRLSSTNPQDVKLSSAQINASNNSQRLPPPPPPPLSKARTTPWLKIVTNPSVLALTLVKFTYNIGMDFIFLQLAVYLREAHSASIETISAIASGSYLMQMVLISLVGWLAKALVLRRALGLSVTKWRKIFQGGSNLLMALGYLVLAYLEPGIEVATSLILAVAFFWMLGAGGESMVPYDLSSKFPASIMGFAHSVSICSGITLTALFGLVLGEQTTDSSRWSLLFLILASLLAFGGLAFVCVLKAKPFLPGEKQSKQQQQQQVQPINSISMSRAASAKEREANSSQAQATQYNKSQMIR